MRLTEEEIREITLSTIEELGEKASPDFVKKIVKGSVSKIENKSQPLKKDNDDSGRIILTSFGLNKPGVVAAITNSLADSTCDIQDMSQKILGEFYTVIMIVDISNSSHNFSDIQSNMIKIAEELNIKIFTQHEDIFKSMHRL